MIDADDTFGATMPDTDVLGSEAAAIAAPGLGGVVLLPGLAIWRRWPVTAAVVFIAGVIAPMFALLMVFQHRNDLVGLFTRPSVLRGTSIVFVMAIIARFAAVWLTSDRIRDEDAQRRMRLMGSLVVALLAVPTVFAVSRMEEARSVVKDVFGTNAAKGTVKAQAGLDPNGSAFQTVLLIGSDEGDNRVGIRTDTMILAFVHKATGHTTLVSVPRNLTKLQFPPGTPMAEKYPNGFTDLANAVYTEVVGHSAMKAYYSKDGVDPGVNALMQGLSYSLGITIDDYLMVNSCAFVAVVDAVGGVTIKVTEKLPMPGGLTCSKYPLQPYMNPGTYHFDGTHALGYVRSRKADSDYHRMQRQRELLEAILHQVGVGTLLTHFGDLAAAVRDNVRTTMTVTEARTLLSLLQRDSGKIESVGLVPPIVEPSHPDFAFLKVFIQQVRTSTQNGTTPPTVPGQNSA